MTFQFILHYSSHLFLPILGAYLFYKKKWKQSSLLMLSMMIVDLDHLFATPIYDSTRNSIGFHPLHTYWAIGAYFLFLLPKKTRVFALGLLIHMLVDILDYNVFRFL